MDITASQSDAGAYRLLMATQAGLKRMSRLWSAIEQHSELDPKSKEHYLKIVGYCMGSRADVPGIYNPRSRRGPTGRGLRSMSANPLRLTKKSRARTTSHHNGHTTPKHTPRQERTTRQPPPSRRSEVIADKNSSNPLSESKPH